VIGRRAADRQRTMAGDEFREQRLALGLSQTVVATAAGISRSKYARAEAGALRTLSLEDASVIAQVLGLDAVLRFYPGGIALRDRAQSNRLALFLQPAAGGLRYKIEVPLPSTRNRLERRAWDAMLYGDGQRTAIELEMRLRDVQAVRRRHALKRRDDPTEHFLLLIANSRHNRHVLVELNPMFDDLPRLRSTAVLAALQAGTHPGTGLVLI
jgi:transcriptional regulator with XRE-family HTH domain